MPLFEWNDKFELGIKEIDQQHKQLMELVNTIYDEFKGGATVPVLKSLLHALIEGSHYHFECEEQWMAETAYPAILEHKREHEKFKVRVAEIDKLFEQGRDNSLDLMLFLNNWIRHHLLEVDAKFADHLITCDKGRSTVAGDLPFHLMLKKYLSS